MSDILNQVNKIFKDVLDNETISLKDETTVNDIEDWDSLNNIQIIVAIEKHFQLRFTSMEIQSFKNVGEMCDAIQKQVN